MSTITWSPITLGDIYQVFSAISKLLIVKIYGVCRVNM